MWKRIALLQMEGVNFEPSDASCTKSKDVFKQRVWLVSSKKNFIFFAIFSYQEVNKIRIILLQEMFQRLFKCC